MFSKHPAGRNGHRSGTPHRWPVPAGRNPQCQWDRYFGAGDRCAGGLDPCS